MPFLPLNRDLERLCRQASLMCVMSLSLLATGCISLKQYVDPTLPKVTVADLKQPETRQSVQLFLEYQNNGVINPQAADSVRPIILATLKKSNLFSDVVMAPASADRKLFITINNFPVTKNANGKAFMTGFTFGLAGTMITDGFQMNAAYDVPGQAEVKHSYRHALYSTIGNADGPANLAPVAKDEAIPLIMNGMVLNLLNDMSRAGELN
ncbi:hypothetical protein BCF11_4104 [Collimonas sp. PA-H2]|uniref:hypothetical protein n=1 Tax=Collimonas sp. PA-H2 TaxID=1881062 RepID=UPI000C01C6D7|nr:hypothetical protein [Collimonas sp. PA-H2]PFH11652.1 hypothetical protein BCF11_4104 [Collimonas sp. PA-H2]